MVTFEQVEKLCKRTSISYEEAKKVLEETNGDLLEAVILLERQHRIEPPKAGGHYDSREDVLTEGPDQKKWEGHKEKSSGEMVTNFFKFCGKILHKGNTNNLEVRKDDASIMAIPLTAMVLLLIFAFYAVIPLLIIGLIFGYRYRFIGPDLEITKVNEAMDTISDATVRAVNSIVDATEMAKDKGEQNDGKNSNH